MYFIGEPASQHAGARIRSVRSVDATHKDALNAYIDSIIRPATEADIQKLTERQRQWANDGYVVNTTTNKVYIVNRELISGLSVWEIYEDRCPIEYQIHYGYNKSFII